MAKKYPLATRSCLFHYGVYRVHNICQIDTKERRKATWDAVYRHRVSAFMWRKRCICAISSAAVCIGVQSAYGQMELFMGSTATPHTHASVPCRECLCVYFVPLLLFSFFRCLFIYEHKRRWIFVVVFFLLNTHTEMEPDAA